MRLQFFPNCGSLKAVQPISETDKAYLAAILDGEGCLGIYKTKGKYYVTKVQVTNTRYELLQWLQERWGGTIYSRKFERGNRKECWLWSVAANKAKDVVSAALPYLLLKRAQALAIIQVQEMRAGALDARSPLYETLYAKLKTLNRRGKDATN